MYPLKLSTALTVPFFAHDANGDGVTGIADGSWTKRISKNGGAFAAMTVTITEMENGWYSMPISTSHSDTLGLLSISLSAAAAKRVNLQFRVHTRLADDLAYPSTSGRAMDVDASGGVEVGSFQTGAITAGAFTAGAIDAAAIAADAIGSAEFAQAAADKVWASAARTLTSLGASLVQEIWDRATSALTTAGSIGKLLVDNLNATVSSRASQTSVDTIDDFVDAEVAAIKAKTDQLTFTNANKVDAAVLAAGDFAQGAADKAWSTAARALTDKDGFRLSATGVDDILDEAVEGSRTVRQYLRGMAAALLAKLSGAATTTVSIRDVDDTKARVTATVDADGNRTAVTLDLT